MVPVITYPILVGFCSETLKSSLTGSWHRKKSFYYNNNMRQGEDAQGLCCFQDFLFCVDAKVLGLRTNIGHLRMLSDLCFPEDACLVGGFSSLLSYVYMTKTRVRKRNT